MKNFIEEDIQTNLKMIVNSLNSYVKSNHFQHILDIEECLKSFFYAQVVKFWYYDEKTSILTLLDTKKSFTQSLSKSLTQQAINKKSSIISNHITSDKYYNQDIDNPLDLKIKALLIFPIMKSNKVIGILRIWRDVKQKKSFIKKDEINLKLFSPLFLGILESQSISKEKLLQLLETNQGNTDKQQPVKKNITEKKETSNENIQNIVLKTGNSDKEENDLKSLKVKERLKTKKQKINHLQEEIKINEQTYLENIKKLKNDLKNAQKEQKELESLSVTLYENSQKQTKELKEQIELLNRDNKALLQDIKNIKESSSLQSIKQRKLEQSLSRQSQSLNIDENIEFILQKVDHTFEKNEYAYILFELIVYLLHSKKGLSYMNESIKKSKLIQNMIDEYYFQSDLQIYNEKYRISDLIKHIQIYEKNIFSNIIKLNIAVDESMPVSLVFDAPKIQSILLHLLTDLYQFVDYEKTINLNFNFKNKLLYIEIGGFVYQKNSLFQSMFKEKKIGGDEKNRIGLQLSKKLIIRLKGAIEYLYENEYYKFILTVPAQVIKM